MKRIPWISLGMLMIAYASFGWFLISSGSPKHSYLLVLGWIWLLSEALIDPLSDFSRFVTRWFKSDTVAFLSIFMLAGLAAVILFWLQIFLYILTIIATESLARLDVQILKFSKRQTFWLLSSVSLIGLGLGLGVHFLIKETAIFQQLPLALINFKV